VGTITDRTAEETDYQTWRVLWAGCNAFYGRSGDTSVPDAIIETTWRRFFDPAESMRALVAELDGESNVQDIALYARIAERSGFVVFARSK
jgi:hypothetical protein